MKLYSEEQVKEMLNKINALLPSDDKESLLKYAVEHITHYMTPIKLPIDKTLFPEAVQRAKDIIENSNLKQITMKTAMQELIDDLKKLKKDSKENGSIGTFDIGLNFAIARAERRLEKEKEQIKKAHFTGWEDAYEYISDFVDKQPRQAEDYYNQTYNQNK